MAICDEAPQVKDATLTPYKDPYNYGDVVRYTCQSGLTLIGSASIECSTDGTFKPDPPTCHSKCFTFFVNLSQHIHSVISLLMTHTFYFCILQM